MTRAIGKVKPPQNFPLPRSIVMASSISRSRFRATEPMSQILLNRAKRRGNFVDLRDFVG
jgi:hypothetical protein